MLILFTATLAIAAPINLAWQDDIPGNNEIYLKISTDGGATWTFQRLSSTAGASIRPSIRGNITITSDSGDITFRNVDLIAGADVEMVYSIIFLPDYPGAQNIYYAATGSLGGKGVVLGGKVGGDGGDGGNAGSISVTGTLKPDPVSFIAVGGPNDSGNIIGFNDDGRPYATDEPLWYFVIGQTIQAEGSDGSKLYRLRVDFAGQALGGSGGIPGGSATSFPGWFGSHGEGGAITGLRIQ